MASSPAANNTAGLPCCGKSVNKIKQFTS